MRYPPMEKIEAARVFVAGGAGFVGSAVVRELLACGAMVTSYDNYFHGSVENLAGLGDGVVAINGDARDEQHLLESMARCQYVINCIGDTYVPTAYVRPQRFFDINVGCALNILRAAQRCCVRRVLYVSSTEVYGSTDVYRLSEAQPLRPVNTYAVSKTAADRLCYTFHLEHGLPVVIARIFNCYGPRETHPYVIPEIIAQFTRGNAVRLGNLQARRDFTYVHDTARALIGVLLAGIQDGDVVNVGSDVTFTIQWLATAIADQMGIKDPVIRSDPNRLRRHDIDCFRCDNEKLRVLTGWRPQVDIVEGIRRTVEWYVANGARWCWEASSQDVHPTAHISQVGSMSNGAIAEKRPEGATVGAQHEIRYER
jgi:nucleoside-diphosphate-sugar epimerase